MKRILVTGAHGTLGRALLQKLRADEIHATDLEHLDVRKPIRLAREYDLVFHLAAAKHAPEGELDPWHTAETNIIGTRNMLETGVRTILASTCKAADPETVYGASKLIAERMTLAAGGSVARFYNIRESSGNVFETWSRMPKNEPLPVTDCWRYFMSIEQAVDLLLFVADAPPGRYTVGQAAGSWMFEEARKLDRGWQFIARRRGDRRIEPRLARCETTVPAGDGFWQIISAHDAVPVAA